MPFEKGQVGNPNGRPRRIKSLTETLRRQLKSPCRFKIGLSNIEAVSEKLIELAVGGDIQAQRLIWDRVEGPVSQKLEHSGGMDLNHNLSSELKEKLEQIITPKSGS